MGDASSGRRYDRHNLAAGRPRLLCAHLVRPTSTRKTTHLRGQGHEVSDMRPGPHPNLCSRLELHQFLRSVHCDVGHLLQVGEEDDDVTIDHRVLNSNTIYINLFPTADECRADPRDFSAQCSYFLLTYIIFMLKFLQFLHTAW